MPILIGAMMLTPTPEIERGFYTAFLIALPIEILAIILYTKALKLSPLSLTLPFLSLTPLFLILNSYLILGEKVSTSGAAGILLIVSGSYLLNIGELRKGIFEPLRAIGREKGSVLMIFVALLYSLTSSLGKMAIENSSALFFGSTYFIAVNLSFAPIAFIKGRSGIRPFMQQKKYLHLIIPGVFYSIMIIAHMTAISMTKVAYMISVKRVSLLMGIAYGYLLFKEENIKGRFLGALLMLAGFILVVNAR
jgi:uncharacterized membrane protein